jgi:hypothetical protein
MKKWIIFALMVVAISGCKKKKNAIEDGGDTGTTSTIPGKPTLITPAQNSICISGVVVSATESQVLFTWSNTTTTTDTKASASLLRNTPYSWYVSAKQNSSTTTTQSDSWKFYNSGAGIITYAPYPAEIVAPAYGQIVTAVNGKINLSWKGSSVEGNITGYNVFLGTTTNPPLAKAVTDNFYNDVAVTANTTYYWRIVTLDSNGNYTDSGLYQFKTQ